MTGPSQSSPSIHRLDEVGSTNAYLKDLAAQGAIHGTLVVARKQTQGRGSGLRSWFSPDGGLYLSVLLMPRQDRPPTDLAFLAGVALVQTLSNLLPKVCDVSLKWPNDCLINMIKVGGVLSESLGEGQMAVVGIGLNVNMGAADLERFSDRPFSATSCQLAMDGDALDLAALESSLTKKLFALYDIYREQGFETIRFLWERNFRFVGKKIEITASDARKHIAQEIKAPIMATVLGIDDLGGLILSNAQGDRRSYFTAEILRVVG